MAIKNISTLTIDSDSYTSRPYGVCTTAAGTQTKNVTNTTCNEFSLASGATILVKFTYGNTIANAKLKITYATNKSTTEKPIYYGGSAIAATTSWQAGSIVEFRYDGTNWHIVSIIPPIASGNTTAGLVSTGAQTFAGNKTFSNLVVFNSNINSNIVPNTTHTYSLGSDTKAWNLVYSKYAVIDESIRLVGGLLNGHFPEGGSTPKEILAANSSRFELGKGFTDKTLWLWARDYKFNTNTNNQAVIISSNGRVGIGDVGGAPAEKLHVSDGYVIANGYKLWTQGVPTATDDGYVVMTNGTYKPLSEISSSFKPSYSNGVLTLS